MVLEFFINNIEFWIFVLFLTIFVIWKRKNLQVVGYFPIMYMMLYKTKLGLKSMKRWSEKHPNVFKYISYISIFVGIVGMIASFISMFYLLGLVIDQHIAAGGFVLPIKTEAGLDSTVPVVYVPFWYWIISLTFLVIVHEFAHGVIAQRWGIKVKSSGFAFTSLIVPLIPAAFVEPDEKQLNKKTWWQKIAVFGAGSMSNFFFGILFLLLLGFVVNPTINSTMEYEGISFSNVLNQSDLVNYNITSGLLLAVNGNDTIEGIDKGISNLGVNQTLNLTIKRGNEVNTYLINTYARSDNVSMGMIGISGVEYNLVPKEDYKWLGNSLVTFSTLLFWLYLLNIGIGFVNLLPLWITDGGQIAYTLFRNFFTENLSNILFNLVSFVSLILFFFAVFPSLLFKFLGIN